MTTYFYFVILSVSLPTSLSFLTAPFSCSPDLLSTCHFLIHHKYGDLNSSTVLVSSLNWDVSPAWVRIMDSDQMYLGGERLDWMQRSIFYFILIMKERCCIFCLHTGLFLVKYTWACLFRWSEEQSLIVLNEIYDTVMVCHPLFAIIAFGI